MTIPPEQREAARYLTGLSGAAPVETHISAVFIGADTVWKLKKAVRMPFLDFSTLAAREQFLRRELELNQPAAPAIYRDVVEVARQPDGTIGIGGGPAIDWVLRMAPVPKDDFLDVVAQRETLTPWLLDSLGDCIAAYHGRLPAVANRDSPGELLRITAGNVRSALAAGLSEPDAVHWGASIAAAIEANRDWFAARSAGGFVRRCHGDLHLGNLCLWDGRPVPFDALEFNEDLATIDVGYDLAFLLMDLDLLVGRGAANRVMNRYVARTADLVMTGLPVFLSQRAMIRAHVLAAMGQDGAGYLAAAQTYLDPVPPMVIAIGGLQGTGKSTLARALAPRLGSAPGALILRSDEIRKRLHGASPEDRLPPGAYTAAANGATDDALIEQAGLAAGSGQALILDATFIDPALRLRAAAVVRQAGVPFLGVWLHAPLGVLEARVAARQSDASDATIAVLHQTAAKSPEAGDWLEVDAGDSAQAITVVTERLSLRSHREDPSGNQRDHP